MRRILAILPLVALLVLTAIFRWTDADLASSRSFYLAAEHTWAGFRSPIAMALSTYGAWPGIALGIGGLVAALSSFFLPRLRSLRRPGFFLCLLLVLGPGLVVNGFLKPKWQRPRPANTVQFDGSAGFVPVWDSSPFADAGASFPSGHASMGFFLMAPAFLFWRRSLGLAAAWFVFGTAAGCVVGLGRISQGAHFASDVLWSGGFVYLSGVILAFLFNRAAASGAGRSTPLSQ